MGFARLRSEMAMVATHCGDDHSSHIRDRLSRSDCALLCKILRRLWHTRTSHAAVSEFLALARRMDTLFGFRLVSRGMADTRSSATWNHSLPRCSLFAAHISIWPSRSPCILGYSFCGNGTIVC